MQRFRLLLMCFLICVTAFGATNSSWSKFEFKQVISSGAGLYSYAKKLVMRPDGLAIAAADAFDTISWLNTKGTMLKRWQMSQPVLAMAFQKNVLLVVTGQLGESYVLQRLELGKKPVKQTLWTTVFNHSQAVFNQDATGLLLTTGHYGDYKPQVWDLTRIPAHSMYTDVRFYRNLGNGVRISLSPNRKHMLILTNQYRTEDNLSLLNLEANRYENAKSTIKLDLDNSLDNTNEPIDFEWSADGRQVFIAQTKEVWNLKPFAKAFDVPALVALETHRDSERQLAWKFTDQQLMVLGANGSSRAFQRTTGQLENEKALNTKIPKSRLLDLWELNSVILFDKSWTRFLTDTTIWHLDTAKSFDYFKPTRAFALSGDQKLIALAVTGQISILEAQTNRVQKSYKTHLDVACMTFSGDKKFLAVGSSSLGAEVIELATGKILLQIPAGLQRRDGMDDTTDRPKPRCPLNFSKDSTILEAYGTNWIEDSSEFWKIKTQKRLENTPVFMGEAFAFKFTQDNRLQVVRGAKRSLVWQTKKGLTYNDAWLTPNFKRILAVRELSPDNGKPSLEIYETSSGKLVGKINNISQNIGFSPDSKLALFKGYRRQIVIDTKTAKVMASLAVDATENGDGFDSETAVFFSPDNQTMIIEFRGYGGSKKYRAVQFRQNTEVPLPAFIREDSSQIVPSLKGDSLFVLSEDYGVLTQWNSR